MRLVRWIFGLAAALPQPVKDLIKRLVPTRMLGWLLQEARTIQVSRRSFPHPLDHRLWSGFGRATARQLEDIQMRWGTKPAEMGAAAWALARWNIGKCEHEAALNQLHILRSAIPNRKSARVLDIDCLTALGRYEEAEKAICDGLKARERVSDICLAAANLHYTRAVRGGARLEADRARLEWVNKVFKGAGFAPIRLIDAEKPLTIGNISTAPLPPDAASGEAKLSVIMPVHNGADTIEHAVRSILAQTWSNLELLIADDASSDNTWALIEKLAAGDRRIVPFRLDRNRGAYAARNTALQAATGQFVTVQDADDWGHPEKFAVQMRDMVRHGHKISATSWVRVTSDLEVIRRPKNEGALIVNFGSLTYPAADIKALHGWDEVWMGGDAELEHRFESRFGVRTVRLRGDVPLTFGLSRPTSLTNHESLGLASARYGARSEYEECSGHWHRLEMAKAEAGRGEPELAIPAKGRAFPAPRICLTGSGAEVQRFDLVFVSDFALRDTASTCDLAARLAGHRLGLKQACMHWPLLDNIGRPHNSAGRSQIHEGIISVVVPEETIECDLAVSDALVLQNLPDRPPAIRAKSCVVLCPQSLEEGAEDGASYDIEQAIENARIVFGVAPVLAPLFGPVRDDLIEVAPTARFTASDWGPLVPRPAQMRAGGGEPGRMPIAGREGTFEGMDWPGDAAQTAAAYGAGSSITFRVHGKAPAVVRAALEGHCGAHWIARNESDLGAFLAGLDFYLYYPHETRVEPSSRAPFDAMAAGVVLVVPPRFARIFSEAAVYAEPEAVAETVLALWSDSDRFAAQAEKGRQWIARRCSPDLFGDRILPFVTPSARGRRVAAAE